MISPSLPQSFLARSRAIRRLPILTLASITLFFAGAAHAADGTWTGGNGSYSDTTKWSGGIVASGTGATAQVDLGAGGSTTLTVNQAVTLGTFQLTNSTSGQGFSMAGSGTVATSTITWAVTSGTPQILLNTWFGKSYTFGNSNLTFTGTQGLTINLGSNTFCPNSGGLSWAGFSGTLTIKTNGENGTIDPFTGNTLPATHFSLAPGSGGSITMGMFAGRDQTLGGFDGTASTYVRNNSSSFSTLTLGSGNDSGNFAGVFGKNQNSASTDFRSNIHIVKNGTGVQRFSGTSYGAGTTTINAGAFLMNGVHNAVLTTSTNTAASAGTAGKYVVNSSGTLGGTGTIVPFDSAGGGVMVAINSGGILSPGDPATSSGIGTLTLSQTNSLQSVLNFATGASASFDLGSNTNDKVAIIGSASVGTEVFFNSTVLNFNDVTGGGLPSGQYVLFQGDANTAYGNLTVDGSGYITGGLSIGSGLSAYSSLTLQLVGNNIVLNLTNSNEPQPVGLSFNIKSSSLTGMTASELAGAPGARFANWNNFNITTAGGTITNILDSNGAAVAGMTVNLTGGNIGNIFSKNISSPSNDTRMFDTVADQYDTTQSTIAVTGIPYSTYDAYFYMSDDGAARGARFTVNGTSYYLRGGKGVPTSSGSNYVVSSDTVYVSGSNTQGNYVKFTGLSGTMTATFVAVNEGDSVQRVKFPGFQIVGMAARPTQAPSAPAGMTITATSMSAVTLQWNASNTATLYQVFRSTTDGVFDYNNPLATLSAANMSYNDTTAVAGTKYYYVVRAVNGAGASSDSAELSTPPPNLSSVAPSSPVIWEGQSTTISWAIPNATSLTVDSGTGAQLLATTGTYPVTLLTTGTYNYTFTGVNSQGQTSRTVSIIAVSKPIALESLWQWSVQVTGTISGETNDYPRAFLYIPPGCQRVRGVIIGQDNLLEKPLLEHPAVRQGLADAGMAAIFVSPAIEPNFNYTAKPNTPVVFQQMMDALAAESGYAELSKTPVVWIGHSAMANAPYYFAAWDNIYSRTNGTQRRCAAAISIKGNYPNYRDANSPTFADSDLAGAPLMFINGEYEDAMGRATSALNFKNNTPGAILSMLADVGAGHFDWHDRVCQYLGMYLRKIGQYRLPATAAADGTAILQTIDTSTQGWMADRWRKGVAPTASPAPVALYTGTMSEAFWYFDQEHASTTNDYYLPVKTQYQLVGYTQNGSPVAFDNTHAAVNIPFSPDPNGDGLTFKLGAAFQDTVNTYTAGMASLPAGSAIGHATSGGPILINPLVGPVEQLSPDTFSIRFSCIGTSNVSAGRSRSIWFKAVHPGDDVYQRAVQQALLAFSLPLTSGAAQTITFPGIADQPIGTTTVALNASTSGTSTYAGAKVYYYVRQGPAKVNGDNLTLTSIPPKAKFPVKVTVVATQYGRSISPLLQSATPVEQTFYITASAAEQWRLQNFGTYENAGNAADTADPDGDGRSNLLEYATGSDPLTPESGQVGSVGKTEDGSRLALAFDRIADPSLTYVVEAKNDLSDPAWTPIWSSTGASNVAGQIVVPDTELVSNQPKRFLRLRITH